MVCGHASWLLGISIMPRFQSCPALQGWRPLLTCWCALRQVEAELAAATSQLSEATSKAREASLLLDSTTIANTHRCFALHDYLCTHQKRFLCPSTTTRQTLF